MANYGIKIGSNILTNTDKELDDTSKYSSLKFFKWGNASFTTNGSGVGSTSITHGLGYAPIALVLNKFTAVWSSPDVILPTTNYTNAYGYLGALNWYGGGNKSIDIEVKVDDDKLYISDNGLGNLLASTTYYFRYYILVDLSQAFSNASNIGMTENYGYKVSKPGKNVLTAEEYEMEHSSKYKSLQFYANHIQSTTLTLPVMNASVYDPYVEEAVYVDFEHNLGYAPLFLAYFGDYPLTTMTTVPFYTENGLDTFNYNISGFSDANRIRIYFWRCSSQDSVLGTYEEFAEETLTIKCIIFTEDLGGAESG